jgi:polysaccharide deacetylase family protein (PEP-CTERM system associated)
MREPVNVRTPPVLSIDVEDWPQSTWDRSLPITTRAVDSTLRVLDILGDSSLRATMFVLGKFAEAFPQVVKRIQADGHEVASHGYGHVEIFRQSQSEFRSDISKSKDLLEQLIGQAVRGYRAPDFSVVKETLWALPIIADIGFTYDSSIFPVRRPRYGIPTWPTSPVLVRFPNNQTLLEAPIATISLFGRNWPIGGGGYHRLLPGFVSRLCARKAMSAAPFVFYCHPYEFDYREFRELSIDIPVGVRLHQGLGRRMFEPRFKKFVARFGGQRAQDLLSSREWPELSLDRFINADAQGAPATQ